MSDLGSATVTVSAPSALPVDVSVVIADPVDDATLIADAQVLGDPQAVDQRQRKRGPWHCRFLRVFAAERRPM